MCPKWFIYRMIKLLFPITPKLSQITNYLPLDYERIEFIDNNFVLWFEKYVVYRVCMHGKWNCWTPCSSSCSSNLLENPLGDQKGTRLGNKFWLKKGAQLGKKTCNIGSQPLYLAKNTPQLNQNKDGDNIWWWHKRMIHTYLHNNSISEGIITTVTLTCISYFYQFYLCVVCHLLYSNQ